MEDCPPGGCISELATQMAIILAGKQFIFTFSQFVIPIMISNKKTCFNAVKPVKLKKGGGSQVIIIFNILLIVLVREGTHICTCPVYITLI